MSEQVAALRQLRELLQPTYLQGLVHDEYILPGVPVKLAWGLDNVLDHLLVSHVIDWTVVLWKVRTGPPRDERTKAASPEAVERAAESGISPEIPDNTAAQPALDTAPRAAEDPRIQPQSPPIVTQQCVTTSEVRKAVNETRNFIKVEQRCLEQHREMYHDLRDKHLRGQNPGPHIPDWTPNFISE